MYLYQRFFDLLGLMFSLAVHRRFYLTHGFTNLQYYVQKNYRKMQY